MLHADPTASLRRSADRPRVRLRFEADRWSRWTSDDDAAPARDQVAPAA